MPPVVSVVKAQPGTILSDCKRVMELASWQSHLTGERELLLKLNDIFPEGIEIPAMYEGRVEKVEIAGEGISQMNFGFSTRKSLVIWGDQMLRLGPLRFLERLLLHSPLVVWAPFASNVYHDYFWYPTIGRRRIRAFSKTPWSRLFDDYAVRQSPVSLQ